MRHLMVDLEAYGKPPDGIIVSIGAAFLRNGELSPDQFYVNVDPRTQKTRTLNWDTMDWWAAQPREAQQALRQPKPISLEEALGLFYQYVVKVQPDCVWANGVSFDLELLRHAFENTGAAHPDDNFLGYPPSAIFKAPWGYRQEMCLRPVRHIGRAMGVLYEKSGVEHHALDDAVSQLGYLQAVADAIGWEL